MKKYVVTLIFIIALFLKCSDRDRVNPLDPENSATKGKVSGLSVYSKERTIFLTWKKLGLTDIDSLKIYRKVDNGEIGFYASMDAEATMFVESNVQYGKVYQYAVTVCAGGFETPMSDLVQTQPGPTYLWVGDANDGLVTRMTHDLSSALFRFGPVRYPTKIVTIPGERAAWCFSLFSDVLYKIDRDGDRELGMFQFGRITDMAADTSRWELWLTNVSSGKVWRLSRSGDIRSEIRTIPRPGPIAVDSRRHIAWVIDEESKKVYRVTRTGYLNAQNQSPLTDPQDVTIDELSNRVWIADKTRVVQLDNTGKETGMMADGFSRATLVRTDPVRKNLWIVDRGNNDRPAALVKLNSLGLVAFRLEQVANPVAIDVNQFDGSCFVADPGRRAVLRVSENGASVDVVGNFRSPQTVAVEHH